MRRQRSAFKTTWVAGDVTRVRGNGRGELEGLPPTRYAQLSEALSQSQ